MNQKEEKPSFEHPQPQNSQPVGQVFDAPADMNEVRQELKALEERIMMLIATHIHNGTQSPRINANTDIIGLASSIPAGNNGEIQYNNNGVLGGMPSSTYDTTTGDVSLTGGNNFGAGNGNVYLVVGVSGGVYSGDINASINGLATNSNHGFLIISNMSGAPTGTPVQNGAMVYDVTNNKLWIYNGAWKSAVFT